MKRFVIGDIHGQVEALKLCLDRSGFDKENDLLICLGDICDRDNQVKESFDELLSIRNLEYVMGNHDMWLYDWAKDGHIDPDWLKNGGKQTIESYGSKLVTPKHIDLFEKAHDYYLTNDNKLFVHAGIDTRKTLESQSEDDLYWDRDFIFKAMDMVDDKHVHNITGFDEVYIGHTPTTALGDMYSEAPIQIKEVWMMDTGAGHGGKLTIMDIDTKEYWQSDKIG